MASRWRVEPDEIDLRMAELQNATGKSSNTASDPLVAFKASDS